MQSIWYAYFGMLVCVVSTMIWMDKRAVMRGQGTGVTAGSRKDPIPAWLDKVLRFFFFWCLVSPLCILTSWWLALPLLLYVPSYLDGSEKHGGRPSEFHKNLFLWFMFKRRMNMKLVVTSKLDAKTQYIFGLHPHGILPWGGVLNMATNVNNSKKALYGVDFHFIAASFCFYVPFYRDLLLGGGICDAARVYAERLLCSGKSIGIVPGGATEALYAKPGDNTVYIKKRRGFVHLAMQTGSSLVPVYTFGENDSYNQLSDSIPGVVWVKKRFQRVFGISLPLITNLIPLKCNATTVVGKPIRVEKNLAPTDAQVDAVLGEYVTQLEKLFDEHHDACLPGREKNFVVI
mmetsp:Transcript_43232/g.108249  ORF Transcript_43232/g.108249 Transcript_43232/m.108249 type:complete len:346 (-) Transcript_43232:435-1472(-)